MTRLDTELVRRGLARSRRRAAELVAGGHVRVAGRPVRKPAHPVGAHEPLSVDQDRSWVSRGGEKLAGALADLTALGEPLPVAGAWCLDAGASTGGFTQVLLAAGAAHVAAVDVGHGQLSPDVADDPRVTVREGVNVRDLRAEDLDATPALVVADLSFISLRLVLPALAAVTARGGEMLVLVKPQFEVGRERLGADGVVSDDALRAEAVLGVARAVPEPFEVTALVPSRLAGPSGNREVFCRLTDRAAAASEAALDHAVAEAVAGRPALVGRDRRSTPRRLA
ncbi:SAM-dependent methyltransferase [Isoptericola sp. b490]|uniref:TlyA family RNA methyltransferase n=1 Tax=Actinotalea lenta TaxID=3064654 RepID=UPI002713206B|nr:SAM-dependent methyltransferase [Isoptericola sp. b490]MDO8120860.1 SAM-dependent methyltransferase [Isoptericola sp. b490]